MHWVLKRCGRMSYCATAHAVCFVAVSTCALATQGSVIRMAQSTVTASSATKCVVHFPRSFDHCDYWCSTRRDEEASSAATQLAAAIVATIRETALMLAATAYKVHICVPKLPHLAIPEAKALTHSVGPQSAPTQKASKESCSCVSWSTCAVLW
jgi:hypothetical protein